MWNIGINVRYRVPIPILETGLKMTCIDYSEGMLDLFTKKIVNKNNHVDLVKIDVTKLDLKKVRYDSIAISFDYWDIIEGFTI